jgi:ribose transport system ATP-binding protein
VAENLLLPKLVKGFGGLASTRANQRKAAELLAAFGASEIAPSALVGGLSLAERQRIEIVRALSQRPRLLVLDEPTAALAQPEWLFRELERIAAAGVAILYITHRLAEVRRLCARATVLRNGENIGTIRLDDTPDAEIFGMMVGAAPQNRAEQISQPTRTEAPAISARALSGASIFDVSFDVHAGEIVGVAALEGQGQRELFRMLGGAARIGRRKHRGTRIDGEPSLAEGCAARGNRLPAGGAQDRRDLPGLACLINISLPVIGRLLRFGLIDRGRERDRVSEHDARHVELDARQLDARIESLSGGNQQKALFARVLLSGAPNLVLFDPTRGVDVGTKQVIYGVIRRFVAAGGSVLIHSTELAELVQLVHRCLVLYRGRIVGEVAGEALAEARLVSLATGHGTQA